MTAAVKDTGEPQEAGITPREFGERIRVHRDKLGLDMDSLAARLKLSRGTLRAIEEGDLDRLPHAVYAKGFVRSYAQSVGLEADEIDAGIEALFPSRMFAEPPTVPVPFTARAKGKGKDKMVATLLVLALIILPLAVGWFIYTHYGDELGAMVKRPFSAAPQSAPEAAPRQGDGPAPIVADSPSPPQAESPAAENTAPAAIPAEPQTPVANEPPLAEAQPVPVQPAPPVVEQRQAPVPVDGKQIAITARSDCWVQATVDGAFTRQFTVYPGETSVLPYKRRVSIVVGNSGGISITHNGQPYALNGKPNERRTLVFE